MRSLVTSLLIISSVVFLNSSTTRAQPSPDDSSVSSPPQAVLLFMTAGERGAEGTATYALLLAGQGEPIVHDSEDGWTVRTYSEGTFELRSILHTPDSAGGMYGDLCETGRVAALRTRTNEALGIGSLAAELGLGSSGPLGPAGGSAAISGSYSPEPGSVPNAPHFYWLASLTTGVVSTEARSWGEVKTAFR